MESDELAFFASLQEKPNDETTRLVYADWLDEHDEPRKAQYLRTLVSIRRSVEELAKLSYLDNEWLECVNAQEDEYEAHIISRGLKLNPLDEIMKMRTYPDRKTVLMDFNELNGDTIRERYEAINLNLTNHYSTLLRESKASGQVWICTSPEICSIFETDYKFSHCGKMPTRVGFASAGSIDTHPTYVGVAGNRWHVYKHQDFPTSELLMGIGKGNVPAKNLVSISLINFII